MACRARPAWWGAGGDGLPRRALHGGKRAGVGGSRGGAHLVLGWGCVVSKIVRVESEMNEASQQQQQQKHELYTTTTSARCFVHVHTAWDHHGWMDGSDREQTPGFRQRAGPAPRRSPYTAHADEGKPAANGVPNRRGYWGHRCSHLRHELTWKLCPHPYRKSQLTSTGGHGHVLGRDNAARTNPGGKAHQGWHTPPAPWPLQTPLPS